MDAIDFFWHLANLFGVGLMFGAVLGVGAKLLWRSALKSVSMLRVVAWVAAGACAVTAAGLVVFGRDGRMATYGAMALVGALTLAWLGRPGKAK